jgi:4-aminobutyrate aminotransferase/(S)-3-amino-2-methylpropionate transaminase
MSDRLAMEQPFFADEPLRPTVRTEIPGPESRKAIEDLNKIYDASGLNMLVNYQKSFGN